MSTASTPENDSMATSELASLQNRFFAALIDGVIVCVCAMPVIYMLTKIGLPTGIFSMIVSTLLTAGIFLALNFKSLDANGQTIGKGIMKLQIIGRDNQQVPVQELVKRRYLPIFAVSAIPYLGPLIALANVLLIFRESRACGHDEIAETKVIQL